MNSVNHLITKQKTYFIGEIYALFLTMLFSRKLVHFSEHFGHFILKFDLKTCSRLPKYTCVKKPSKHFLNI